jgi:transposase
VIRVTDEQWDRIREHFPEERISEDRPGRKPVAARKVLDAALWILATGAQWHLLPQCYPNCKTVHRRFQQWCTCEVLRSVLTDLANALREHGAVEPDNLIGGRAYDSDKLDEELRRDGLEMISPHRANRIKKRTQDGRHLRRYERRWLVERFFAWMQWHRRLLVRWEYYSANFLRFCAACGHLHHA